MPRQAIRQATCENCTDDNAEFSVSDKRTERESDDDDRESYIEYDVTCSCGNSGKITIDTQGTSASDEINHDDASWNERSDDE